MKSNNSANIVAAHCWGLSRDTLMKILDNINNEIYVLDKNYDILYINKNSILNYGLSPDEMIGKNHYEFVDKYWFPSVVSLISKEKRMACIDQVSITGKKFICTAVPVFDEQQDLEMIVSVIQEEPTDFDFTIDLQENDDLFSGIKILTRSPKMHLIMKTCNNAAKSDVPVLIQGDSGTGKSMMAKYIHQNSPRRHGPFLCINCASIPESLLESELFGYEPHSFTGASKSGKTGLIELADNGTLFLDEIGELSGSSQAKLLSAIESHQITPVGGSNAKHVNVRIITATNQNLQEFVYAGKFREDLFWRLNVFELELPPLASRAEDIVLWATYFLNYYNKKYSHNKTFASKVIEMFINYDWPGNIRQLKNVIERAFIMSRQPEFVIADFPPSLVSEEKETQSPNISDFRFQMEKQEQIYVSKKYAQYKSCRKMAKAINISHSKANELINKYCRLGKD